MVDGAADPSHQSELPVTVDDQVDHGDVHASVATRGTPKQLKFKDKHVVVMQHGFFGSPTEWRHLKGQLLAMEKARSLPGGTLAMLTPAIAPGPMSNRGIDVIGEKLADLLLAKCGEARAISFVGHSMGGLITRYAIGKLQAHGFFDTVRPVNFVTLATPHEGALKTKGSAKGKATNNTAYYRCINYSGEWTGRSGTQMALVDDFHDGVCLLRYMATPGTPFFEGLARFQRRGAYGLCFTDGLVATPSSTILDDSPFIGAVAVPLADDGEGGTRYPSLVRPVQPDTPALQAQFKAQERWREANRIAKLTLLNSVLWLSFQFIGLVSLACRVVCAGPHASHDWLLPSKDATKEGEEMSNGDDEGSKDAAIVAPSRSTPLFPRNGFEGQMASIAFIADHLGGAEMPWERHYVFKAGLTNHFFIHQAWIGGNDVLQHVVDTFAVE